MTEIYIEGLKMDVSEDSFNISRTLQHFDYLNIGKSVVTDRTNRLKLPLTPKNKRNLELLDGIAGITSKPYVNLSVIIVVDSITYPVAVCQIVGVEEFILLDVQGNVKKFFEAIDGKTLNDLDLSAYNGLWDNTRHDTVRNTTSGLVCPVIDTNHLVDGTTYVDGYTHGISVVPCFYYKTIIDAIFTLAGFTKTGAVFSDTVRYQKMVMTTLLKFNSKFIAKKQGLAFKTGSNQTVIAGTSPIKITFNSVAQGSDNLFQLVNNRYYVNNPTTALKYFSGKFSFYGDGDGAGTPGTIHIYKNGVSIASVVASASASTNYFTLTTSEQECKHGDYFECFITATAGQTVTIRNSEFKFEPSNTTDTSLILKTDWYWYFDQLLENIYLIDFIRDFMVQFGLVLRGENTNIEFVHIKDIIKTTSTQELSKENVTRVPSVRYEPTGFAQINNYKWYTDPIETQADTYGMGTFSIVNARLPKELTKYTSIFSSSNSSTSLRMNKMGVISIYNKAGSVFTKASSFRTRLFLLRDDDGVSYRFVAGTSRTDYFIAYFINKENANSLDFQEILTNYYSEYINTLITYVSIEQSFLLSSVQIKTMDLFKTKHYKGNNYIVERISDHKNNEFATIKMIKI